jgi:hypothetical protein
MHSSNAAAASSTSKRTRAQTRAASAAAALTSSSANDLAAAAAASPSPLSILTDPAKRQRREDESTEKLKVHAASDDERMEADDVKEERKSVAPSNADNDRPVAAALATSSLQASKGGHAAPSPSDSAVSQARTHVISPIGRLDLDSLSVVLSLLSTDDFLAALRVNKQFYAARLKHTAWPTLRIGSFIQSLNDDDYDNPARRRLRVHATKDHLPHFAAMLSPPSGASAALTSIMWRHVTDAHVYSRSAGSRWSDKSRRPNVSTLLPQLSQLPFLTAVDFHNVDVSATSFQQFAAATAPRLQVLMFEGGRSLGGPPEVDHLQHVGLLRGLRVLVLDGMPDATSLLQLHQLEHLHFMPGWNARLIPLATTIRYLNQSHALRSLSLGDNGASHLLHMVCGTAPHQHLQAHFGPTALPNPTAALVDWTRPCALTALSLDGALLWRSAFLLLEKPLPALVTLKVHMCKKVRWAPAQQPDAPEPMLPQLHLFSRVHQLCLTIDESDLLEHVAQCTQLRRLQLNARRSIRATAEMMCKIVQANANSLEELRLCHSGWRSSEDKREWPSFALIVEADENNPADVADMERWSVLADCPHLRIVELPIKNEVAPQLLSALAKTPVFQALELSLPPRLYPQSHPLLQSALSSRTWCTIRFYCAFAFQLPNATELEDLLPAAGAASDAAPSNVAAPAASSSSSNSVPNSVTLRRLRVFARRSTATEHCFMLHSSPTAAASFEWQQEY